MLIGSTKVHFVILMHVGIILANVSMPYEKVEESCRFSVNIGEIEKLLIGKEQLNTN